MSANLENRRKEPYVRIVEQPGKSVRFRDMTVGYNKSFIKGRYGKKSFPTICVENYSGPVSVIVSCVTSDPPYRPHPYKLCNGDKLEVHGACFFRVTEDEIHKIDFRNLSIVRMPELEMKQSLSDRQKALMDSWGFDPKYNTENIDVGTVRLCFQVFLENGDSAQPPISLEPVISNPIVDAKTGYDLTICWLSHNSAPAIGGTKMCLLCERVPRHDIEVVFFSEDGDWEMKGIPVAPHVFKRAAIFFKTPEYRTKYCKPEDVQEPINAYIQLRRISQEDKGAPRAFQILPIEGNEYYQEKNSLKRKRSKYSHFSNNMLEQSQTEIILNPHVLNTNKTLNLNCRILEPWELPHITEYPDLQPTPQITNFNTNNVTVNNTAINTFNAMPCEEHTPSNRNKELLNLNTGTVFTQHFPQINSDNKSILDMFDSVPKEICKQANENLCKIPYESYAQKQQQGCHSTDTFNPDTWFGDLLDIIKPDDYPVLQPTVCNPITENKIASEPDIGYIIPNDGTLQSLENMGNNNINVMDMNPEQLEFFFNNSNNPTSTVQQQSYQKSLNSFNDVDNNPNTEINSSQSKGSIQEFI